MISAYSAYGSGGASTKVRLYDWFDHIGIDAERYEYLGRNGNPAAELLRHPLGVARAESALRRRARKRDSEIAIVSREVSPLSTGRLEASLLSQAARGVFDFDDAIWLPASGPRGWLNQERKASRAIQAADVVIAGNEVLADWASQYARDVVIIPSCVEPDDYQPKTSWDIGDLPRLVWLGSASTEQYVVDIAPALEQVCLKIGAVLTVISGPVNQQRPLDQWSFVRRVQWSPEAARVELAAADLAIAPLRSDEYARGKCAYKLLQYAASGLPMVGSPVGANQLALQRFDGLAASTSDEWVDALTDLIATSAAVRERQAGAGFASVNAHYSFGAWSDTWLEATRGSRDGGLV